MEIVRLLRDFTMKEKRIPVEDGKVRFDNVEYHMKVKKHRRGGEHAGAVLISAQSELPLKGTGGATGQHNTTRT
jgi:hypothetical protein